MALTLGTSAAASMRNMQYLSQTKSLMDKSLQRISSGKRILSSGDDPGGLAFSMRLQSELTINNTVQSSVENGKSFLEVQDGALKAAGDLVTQMRTLKNNYDTAIGTSNSATAEVYARQFRDLQVQLGQLQGEKLNGSSLFNVDPNNAKIIYTSSQGASGSKISLGMMNYNGAFGVGSGNLANATQAGTVVMAPGTPSPATGDSLSISQVTDTELQGAFDNISGLRAQSGGKLSTLGFVSEYLGKKSASLEAANSRIMDADIAEESINYSKYSLQYQAGAAALAQSNLSMQVVLDLLKLPSIRS
jgi:flagellin